MIDACNAGAVEVFHKKVGPYHSALPIVNLAPPILLIPRPAHMAQEAIRPEPSPPGDAVKAGVPGRGKIEFSLHVSRSSARSLQSSAVLAAAAAEQAPESIATPRSGEASRRHGRLLKPCDQGRRR